MKAVYAIFAVGFVYFAVSVNYLATCLAA